LPFFRPGLPWFFRLWFFRLCLPFSVRLLSWFFRRFPAVDRLRLFHLALFWRFAPLVDSSGVGSLGVVLPWWVFPFGRGFALFGFPALGMVRPFAFYRFRLLMLPQLFGVLMLSSFSGVRSSFRLVLVGGLSVFLLRCRLLPVLGLCFGSFPACLCSLIFVRFVCRGSMALYFARFRLFLLSSVKYEGLPVLALFRLCMRSAASDAFRLAFCLRFSRFYFELLTTHKGRLLLPASCRQ
jgi:hypothetical protein